MERPSTSKPRGICKYYETPRGCFAGKECKFLHGQDEKLTPYDKNKTCRYYRAGASPSISLTSDTGALTDAMLAGYCKRGDRCWFLHVDGSEGPSLPGSDAECIICYDRPVTYGLMGAFESDIHECFISDNRILDGCSHVLCVQVCITSWT
jgi:E3 ubiquitin-protein ligase makorin